jgi:hypothetical protein
LKKKKPYSKNGKEKRKKKVSSNNHNRSIIKNVPKKKSDRQAPDTDQETGRQRDNLVFRGTQKKDRDRNRRDRPKKTTTAE